MGGMLGTGALSLQGYLSRHIRSVTMLGSGCFGAGSWHSALRPLLLALCALGFPAATLGSIYSTLVGTWASVWPIETLLYWRSNLEVRKRAPPGGGGGRPSPSPALAEACAAAEACLWLRAHSEPTVSALFPQCSRLHTP
jgi:hypothetical protein